MQRQAPDQLAAAAAGLQPGAEPAGAGLGVPAPALHLALRRFLDHTALLDACQDAWRRFVGAPGRIRSLGSPAVSELVSLPITRGGAEAKFGLDMKPLLAKIAGKLEKPDGFQWLSPRNLPDEHVNGALTVGENIGDLGGLSIADDDGPDAVLVFVTTSSDVESLAAVVVSAAGAGRITWMAYPKAKQLGTDLNRDILWKQMQGRGVDAVRLRYHSRAEPCRVVGEGPRLELELREPFHGAAPCVWRPFTTMR